MGPKFLFFGVVFGFGVVAQAVRSTTVTNEDIRDAILQVVNVVRATEDKLERHEFRERVLGEQLKKGMISIDKRIKMLDPSRGPISRLDQRLAAVETILIQKDERERIQLQKTFDTVEDIQKNLPTIVDQLKRDIIEKLSDLRTTAGADDKAAALAKNFDDFRQELNEKIGQVTKAVGSIEADLGKMMAKQDVAQTIHDKSAQNLDGLKNHLNTTKNVLEKYENKLAEYNNRITEKPPISHLEQQQQNDWQTNFMKALEIQKSNVEQILSEVQSMSDKLTKLPNKTDIENAQNATLDSLELIRYESAQQPVKSSKILDAKVQEIRDDVNRKHDETIKSINEMSELTETLTESFSNNYDQIRNEIQNLGKVEQVMVQTADSVLDTKRRVEYGVHQILGEVGKLLKATSKDLNAAIGERFDMFEASILDDENGALANLTSKIGQEIDQVWRQIGIMHQQMSATGDTLNKLQNQTDAYVNGSLNAMDNMKGKVGRITGRITEVDENLNYLLGKLSLVTQEFNQIKTGLGKALDEMRGTFKSVEDKIKDTGPGPHKINSNEVDPTK